MRPACGIPVAGHRLPSGSRHSPAVKSVRLASTSAMSRFRPSGPQCSVRFAHGRNGPSRSPCCGRQRIGELRRSGFEASIADVRSTCGRIEPHEMVHGQSGMWEGSPWVHQLRSEQSQSKAPLKTVSISSGSCSPF
jgi:hypothetical protein